METRRPYERTLRELLERPVTRRGVIKAAGLTALGLAFTSPLIESMRPTPVFADYVIEDGKKFQVDIEFLPGPDFNPGVACVESGRSVQVKVKVTPERFKNKITFAVLDDTVATSTETLDASDKLTVTGKKTGYSELVAFNPDGVECWFVCVYVDAITIPLTIHRFPDVPQDSYITAHILGANEIWKSAGRLYPQFILCDVDDNGIQENITESLEEQIYAGTATIDGKKKPLSICNLDIWAVDGTLPPTITTVGRSPIPSTPTNRGVLMKVPWFPGLGGDFGRVLAHELGHSMGLKHADATSSSHLMIKGGTGKILNSGDLDTAVDNAKKLLDGLCPTDCPCEDPAV